MTTHEEKLRSLLPFAEYAHEDGCLCADCVERRVYNNVMKDIFDNIKSKVILREELMTKLNEIEKYLEYFNDQRDLPPSFREGYQGGLDVIARIKKEYKLKTRKQG